MKENTRIERLYKAFRDKARDWDAPFNDDDIIDFSISESKIYLNSELEALAKSVSEIPDRFPEIENEDFDTGYRQALLDAASIIRQSKK